MKKLPIHFVITLICILVSCSNDDDSVERNCVNDFLDRYGYSAEEGDNPNGCVDFLALYEFEGHQYFSWGNPCVNLAGPIVFDCDGNEICQLENGCSSCADLCSKIISNGEYKGNVGFRDYLSVYSLLNGEWNMREISGGFAGVQDEYVEDEVIWTFNLSLSRLIIRNDYVGDNLSQGGYSSDTLLVGIKGDVLGPQKLLIEQEEVGVIRIDDEQLEINAECCDRFNYRLTKAD